MPEDRRLRGLREEAAVFDSGAQNARALTEDWAHRSLFCPNCGNSRLEKFANNRPVADFHCEQCSEQYELKSQKGRFGRKVNDGAYTAMCRRLAANDNPNLVLLNYDLVSKSVTHVSFVPKHFFVLEVIEARPPLAPTARRAGWQGCNIRLDLIPNAGRISYIDASVIRPVELVRDDWRRTRLLDRGNLANRGWLMQTLRCVEEVGVRTFELADIYQFEDRLRTLYPNNENIRPKLRQQLQVLRDLGFLEFLGGGRYRTIRPSDS